MEMEPPKLETKGTQWAGSCSVFFLATHTGNIKIMLSAEDGSFSRREFYVNPAADPNLVEMCIYAMNSKTDVWVLVSDIKPDSDLLAFYIYPS